MAPYLWTVAAVLAATFTWFRPGDFVAAGDVDPFFRQGQLAELGSLWGHRISGAGSTSAEIVRAPEVIFAAAAKVMGLPPTLAQHAWFFLMAGLAAAGVAYLAGAVTDRRSSATVAGLVAVFNPLVMINLPNPLSLMTLAAIGFLGGMVLRAAHGRPVTGRQFGVASLLAALLGVNPPLVAVVTIAVLTMAVAGKMIAGKGGTYRACSLLLRAAPWTIVLNLWWVVPFLLVNLGSPVGAQFTAVTNAGGWAWASAQNSLGNVVTLRAQWGWNRPEYYPYASGLDHAPFSQLRWLLPLAAAAAPILNSRRRRAALALAAAVPALVLVAKGLHPPLTNLNLWGYQHLPGMWLLREPMSKVGPLLVADEAVLATLAIEGARHRLASRCTKIGLLLNRSAVGLFLIGTLLAVHPMLSGAVIPDQRLSLPSTHVHVPSGWTRLADAVNGSAPAGKALVLPLDHFYQVTTTWGYHGVDDIAANLLRGPVITQLPGGYYEDLPGFSELVHGVQAALSAGDAATAARLMQALGASDIIIRHDLTTVPGESAIADVAPMEATLANMPGARLEGRFGVADLWSLTSAQTGLIHVYSSRLSLLRPNGAATVTAIGGLDPSETSVNGDEAADSVSWEVTGDGRNSTFHLATSGTYAIERHPLLAQYQLHLVNAEGGNTLQIRSGVNAELDGRALNAGSTDIQLRAAPVAAVRANGTIQPFTGQDTTVVATPGSTIETLATSRSVISQIPSALRDCNAFDNRSLTDAGLLALQLPDHLQLQARAHTACVSFDEPTSPPPGAYLLHIDAQAMSGRPPRLCVWEQGPNHCVPLPPLPGAGQWTSTIETFDIDPSTTALSVFLYADGADDGNTTVSNYRHLTLSPLTVSSVVPLAPVPAETRYLSAGPHDVRITGPDEPPLGGPSAVEDCAATDRRSPAQAGLGAASLGSGTIRLVATAHSACVWMPAPADQIDALHEVQLEYRTLSGRAARICVWEVGPDKCAALSGLATSSNWSSYLALFRPDPGTVTLRLYLYADGQASPRTAVEYRGMGLRPVNDERIDIAPVTAPAASQSPEFSWKRLSPDRYQVTIDRVDPHGRGFTLVLAESFAPGWKLVGLRAGSSAEHIHVDGYANGWTIQGGQGRLSFQLVYVPASVVRLGCLASGAGGAILIFATAATWFRRRRTGRKCPSADPSSSPQHERKP